MPESMVTTVSHDHHRLRRGAMSRYFSKASVLRLEPMVQKYVDSLVVRLRAYKDTQKPVNLSRAYLCFTNDVITEYAMGKSFNSIETSDDFYVDFQDSIKNSVFLTHVIKVFPWIYPLLKNTPLWVTKFLNSKVVNVVEWQRVSVLPLFVNSISNNINTGFSGNKIPSRHHHRRKKHRLQTFLQSHPFPRNPLEQSPSKRENRRPSWARRSNGHRSRYRYDSLDIIRYYLSCTRQSRDFIETSCGNEGEKWFEGIGTVTLFDGRDTGGIEIEFWGDDSFAKEFSGSDS